MDPRDKPQQRMNRDAREILRLEKRLKKAVEKEDYEGAAKIRDAINLLTIPKSIRRKIGVML